MMKNMLKALKKNRYISLFLIFMILFTYLSGLRLYIYENINKSFTLIRLGAEWIDISALASILLALGVVVGAVIALFIRKKISMNLTTMLYALSGLFAIVLLFFTPYNLQLLMPATNLQNITSINLIAVLFFSTIDVALFTLVLGTHILFNIWDITGTIVLAMSIIISVIISMLATVFVWSFIVCIGVYASILLLINTVNSVCSVQDVSQCCESKQKHIIIIGGMFAIAVLTVLISAYFIVNNAIKF